MGESRRMISSVILFNDNYVSLPATAQSLYVYILNQADEHGVCDNVKSFMNCAHAKQKDLKSLIDARYIIELKEGVYLVKHFPMFNKFRREKPYRYPELMAHITKKENGAYTETNDRQCPSSDGQMTDIVCQMTDNVRPREEKRREENRSEEKGIETFTDFKKHLRGQI